ncbi:MAG: hypothetical protein K2N87_20400 [Eubacterium sp.]|nr:hypothetical protein [Eubacterium sp.]
MASKEEKKENIRRGILAAASTYSRELAGKTFLYVIHQTYFEVSFRTNCFLHLTGVATYLSAKNFYKKAQNGTLTDKQFYFDKQHPYYNAKDKVLCLNRLPELTNQFVCILYHMKTLTFVYKIGVTNLEFTLGLTEHIDKTGKKADSLYLPRTLRVHDHSVERSSDPMDDIVDFIFRKDASSDKYTDLMIADKSKQIPDPVHSLLEPDIFSKQYRTISSATFTPVH